MAGIFLKADRAREHLDELSERIRRCLELNYFVEQDDPEGFDVQVFGSPPDNLAVIVGDIVFNLRSCLEHLVWALQVTEDPKKLTAFPICDTPQRYQRSRSQRKLRYVRPDALEQMSESDIN